VAEQQGKYLATQLNAAAKAKSASQELPQWKPFEYHHLGSMALVGESLLSFLQQLPLFTASIDGHRGTANHIQSLCTHGESRRHCLGNTS
jgi:hypothetical protein